MPSASSTGTGCRRNRSAIGIVAGWALLALGLSYYVRDRIGQQRWRFLHRFTAIAWIAGIVHSLGEGTDAGQTWFLIMTAIVVVRSGILKFDKGGFTNEQFKSMWTFIASGLATVTPGANATPAEPPLERVRPDVPALTAFWKPPA